MNVTRRPAIDRVLAMVALDDTSECWVFVGACGNGGYGHVTSGGTRGRMLQAHSVTYEHFIGPVPTGLVLDHLCRNRWCVNPRHVEPVTQRTNILRGAHQSARAVRTQTCKNGHPYAGNRYVVPKGRGTACRACKRLALRAFRLRQTVAS